MLGQGKLNDDDIKLLQNAINDANLASSNNINNLNDNLNNLGMNLSPDGLRMQLQNPQSILSQYFNSMILDYNLAVEKERIGVLQNLIFEKQRESGIEEYLEEKSERETESQQQFSAEQRQLMEKQAMPQQQLPSQMISFEKRKANEMNHWLSVFGKDPEAMAQALTLINKRYQAIENNLKKFNDMLSRKDLSPEQRQDLTEYYEHYQRHLELSSLENKQKYIPDYVKQDVDKDTSLQELKKNIVHEELSNRFVEQKTGEPILSHVEQKQMDKKTGLQVLGKDAVHEELFNHFLEKKDGKPVLSHVEQKEVNPQAKSYRQLLDELNKSVEKFLDQDPKNLDAFFNDEAKSKSFNSVMDVMNSLQQIDARTPFHEINNQVQNTLKSLNSPELSGIKQTLQNWSQKQGLNVPRPSLSTKPNWTQAQTEKMNIGHTGGIKHDKADYFAKLQGIFGKNYIKETETGFKYSYNGREIHFNPDKNEISLKNLDQKSLDMVAKVISETSPKGNIKSMDVSDLPKKYHEMAVKSAQKEGLEVVGLSEEMQQKLTAESTTQKTM